MGLKLLKRRTRKPDETAHTKLSNSGHSQSLCDDSTNSDASRSKPGMVEALCRSAQWDTVLKLVQDSTVDEWNATPSSDAHSLYHTTSPLHLVLAHQAPLKVVESMIEIMHTKFAVPVPEEAQDEFGRTPLHVAVTAGCDEETALRLLRGHGLVMPAVIKDDNEQTPLHLACVSPIVKKQKKKSMFAPSQKAILKWNKRRVMTVLMEEYPEACAVMDKHGKTPLDYAREQELKDSSVQELARLSQEFSVEPDVTPSDKEIAANLAVAGVPFIVPSLSGSCRDFHACSILNLEDLEHQKLPEASDVSTIGDGSADLDELAFVFIP